MQKGGWFSSLRRQPKTSGKVKATDAKQLQKSCVDLSSNSSSIGEKSIEDFFLFNRNGSGCNGTVQITCSECHRYYSPASLDAIYQGKNLDEVVRNAINSGRIGAKYSQTGTTTINKTVNVDRAEEVVIGGGDTEKSAAEFTERITVTKTTVIKKPAKKIEFFHLTEDAAVSSRSEGSLGGVGVGGGGGGGVGGKTVTFSSNRNGLVFDDDGKVLGNSLNFDFEFIDEDRLSSSQSPTPPGTTQVLSSASSTPTTPVNHSNGFSEGSLRERALIKLSPPPPQRQQRQPQQQRLGVVNTCKLGTSSTSSINNICDNCLNKRFKSRSDWNISSTKVEIT